MKRKLVALLLLPYRCLAVVIVLWLFLAVPWVGQSCVIVVFPEHTHLLFSDAHRSICFMTRCFLFSYCCFYCLYCINTSIINVFTYDYHYQNYNHAKKRRPP